MIIASGMGAKFVYYPIHVDPARPDMRLTNWAVMARVAEGGVPPAPGTGTSPAPGSGSGPGSGAAVRPPRRADWNRPGVLADVEPLVRAQFRLDFVDPLALIRASGEFYEYPLCDRDPLPRWSFGRASLLGDAAHPMYPVGSNGASQAILDARFLADRLQDAEHPAQALWAYEQTRLPMTAEIVRNNRRGGPEGVIDAVEERAPDGFINIDDVLSFEDRKAIVRGYASKAGFSREQVNKAA
jgi:2-polyprenyl-6-methoxyphenol hydroxylase-like FAD-dependent oxidoreductase